MKVVDSIHFNTDGSISGIGLAMETKKGWLKEHRSEGDDLILMQWTGLKDKNGKEIWEGDIVQHRSLTRPTDSVMYGLQMQLMPTMTEVKFEECGFTPFAGWRESTHADLEWEIVGNIYENPELLDPITR